MENRSAYWCRERFGDVPAAEKPAILLSIHFTSNRPAGLARFLDRIESSTSDMSAVEVVVKIDDNDSQMHVLLEQESKRRPFAVRYISAPPPAGFYDLWRSYDGLLKAADPRAYFVMCLNDEMYFETMHWDKVLRRYVGLFPDHIFRLRTSNNRTRNYFDAWEAGFANDTSAIMTRRWVESGGGWCPCNGPDTFQQCVAYYFAWLHRFRADRITRELPIYDINLGGHGANLGESLSGRHLRRRIGGSIRPFYILMSHAMQEEAARRAQKLHAHIWAEGQGLTGYEVRDEPQRRRICVTDRAGRMLFRLSYRLSAIRIWLSTARRTMRWRYYAGYVGDSPSSTWFKDQFMHICYQNEYLGRILDVLWFEANMPKPATSSTKLLVLLRSTLGRLRRSCKRLFRLG
jgi:hypothetical protein